MIYLAALAVFSGLSLNLLLLFALGAAGAASDVSSRDRLSLNRLPVSQFGILFLSVLFLWLVFSHVLPPNWKGFSEYFLFFPFSALTCAGFEFLGGRIYHRATGKPEGIRKVFSAITAYEGLVPVSLFITLSLAVNLAEAATLALFFSLGNMTAMLILNEIRRRAALEKVPRFLRGSPLILLSMGLLSLIFGAAAGICFKILEVMQ